MSTALSHANRAKSYDVGRLAYPDAFFDYFDELINTRGDRTIADIGAGTGKVTEQFLKKGYKIFAVEPDGDMMKILKNKTKNYTNCVLYNTVAEETRIPDNAVDMIFCGNSYHWFDREKSVPEFIRILKNPGDIVNVVVATLGAGTAPVRDELYGQIESFHKYNTNITANHENPFRAGTFTQKSFAFTVCETFEQYLHGALSASYGPSPADGCYDEYRALIKKYFDRHSRDGLYEANFVLSCSAGNVYDLVK